MIECKTTSLQARIRNGPNAYATATGTYYYGSTVFGIKIVDDSFFPNDSNYQWLDLGNGTFVAVIYKGQRQLVVLSDGIEPDIFAVIKDDFEIYGLSRPTRNLGRTTRGYASSRYVRGLPMVFPYNGVSPSFLDNVMVNFILRFQPDMSIENSISNLSGLFDPDRAFNNFQSCDFRIEDGNIVNKTNTKYYNVFTGRARIKLVSRNTIIYKGVKSYGFEIIDTKKPYSHYNPQDYPHLFFIPNNSVRDPLFNSRGRWTGYYKEDGIENFHWFEGKTILPIHGYGSSIAYIPANLVRILN